MSDNDPTESMRAMVTGPPSQAPRTMSNSASGIDNLLSQVLNLNNEQMLHEPTCLICSSGLRKEAEEEWDNNHDGQTIIKLFEDRSPIVVSKDSVKNHMDNHKDRGVKELQKVEYIDRIKRLSGKPMTTLDRIDLCLSILTERLMEVNSIVAGGDKSQAEIEKIKSAETSRLMAIFKNFLQLQASILGEMKTSGELITIPKDRFISVFQEALLEADSDREKAMISNLLNNLRGIDN